MYLQFIIFQRHLGPLSSFFEFRLCELPVLALFNPQSRMSSSQGNLRVLGILSSFVPGSQTAVLQPGLSASSLSPSFTLHTAVLPRSLSPQAPRRYIQTASRYVVQHLSFTATASGILVPCQPERLEKESCSCCFL